MLYAPTIKAKYDFESFSGASFNPTVVLHQIDLRSSFSGINQSMLNGEKKMKKKSTEKTLKTHIKIEI